MFAVGDEIATAAPVKAHFPAANFAVESSPERPAPIPDAVVAVDPDGIEIPDGQFGQSGLMQYRIPHLWPGEWAVRMLRKDTVIASTRVKIAGIETITSDLIVDSVRTR